MHCFKSFLMTHAENNRQIDKTAPNSCSSSSSSTLSSSSSSLNKMGVMKKSKNRNGKTHQKQTDRNIKSKINRTNKHDGEAETENDVVHCCESFPTTHAENSRIFEQIAESIVIVLLPSSSSSSYPICPTNCVLCFNVHLMLHFLFDETLVRGRSTPPLLMLAALGLHCGGRKRLYFGIGAAWTDRTLSATRTCSFSGVVISGRTSRAPQDVSRKLSHQQEV